ncbi:macro domain-containing protein [Photobacterium japonica]|uniref:type II toxin-antitoxin system antitoxin DNA ADP-ribosyl glycohydrolase DarG n=1 Tax=Photobacterium japonica TaxID=2910235 RepID=UPI003D1436D2
MISYVKGNILHDQSDAIINTVNTVGVMGKGLALQFKKAFPENFKIYKAACDSNALTTGQMLTVSTHSISAPYYIINFPTKAHWKGKSQIEFIQNGLTDLKREVRRLKLTSVAIPALGSGLGGLPWSDVKREIQAALSDMQNVEWRVYPPQDAPQAEQMVNRTQKPSMTIGRAAVIGLINEYLTTGLHYTLSLLEVQKLVYFLTTAGETLNKVHFQKHHYGPYADVLRHVLDKMEGHFISGYADGLNKPDTPIQLKEGALEEAQSFLKAHPETKQRFDNVTKLVDGFESPYGMELLSTVHWVATQECPHGDVQLDDVITKVHAWSERKAKMKPAHIKAALTRLQEKQWLNGHHGIVNPQ